MNRSDLVDALARRSGHDAAIADAVLAALQSVVTEQLVLGEQVVLPGFLTLRVQDRAERAGRNPATGEPLTIPAARVVKAVPGAALRRAVAAG